jgi:hypothetical protein
MVEFVWPARGLAQQHETSVCNQLKERMRDRAHRIYQYQYGFG